MMAYEEGIGDWGGEPSVRRKSATTTTNHHHHYDDHQQRIQPPNQELPPSLSRGRQRDQSDGHVGSVAFDWPGPMVGAAGAGCVRP